MILDEQKNEEVCAGIFDQKTKIFSKRVLSNHYMVKEKGYGIQSDVIEHLKNLRCERIQLTNDAQILDYPFSLALLKTPKNYAPGKQIFLTIKEALVIKKEVTNPSWLRKG